MRADLQTMEKIDQYLTGKLSGSELSQFKSELAANPELQGLVNDQQLLIQTVHRKALLAEIHAVAGVGGSPWYANPWVAVTGGVLVVGAIATTAYYVFYEPQESNQITAVLETSPSDSLSAEQINYDKLAFEDSTYVYTEQLNESGNKQHPVTNDRQNMHTPDETVCDAVDPVQDDYTHSGPIIVKDQPNDDGDDANLKNRNRKASYPKGDLAMREFIDTYMRFPGTAREKKLSGNVRVKFLVTHDGQRTELDATCFAMRDENDKPLSNTQFVFNQKIAHLFEREAERIIRIMPLWIPATDSGGNAVLTACELYFNFSLKNGISFYRLND